MITIIVLLILAGVTLYLVIGDNGIIKKAKQGEENYTKASLKEEIELSIIDIEMEVLSQGGKLSKEKIVEELPNRLPGLTAEVVGNEIVGEYKDYEFTIDENFEVTIGGKLIGHKPEVTLELMTTEVSSKTQIKVKASVVDSTITELIAPSETILVQEISETEKIYEVTKNATYYFTAKAANGRKKVAGIKVSNILEKPVLEVVEITGSSFKVKISNPVEAEGVVYYSTFDYIEELPTSSYTLSYDNLESDCEYTVQVKIARKFWLFISGSLHCKNSY